MRLRLRTIAQDHAIGPIHMVSDGMALLALEFGDPEHRLMPMLQARFGASVVLDPVDDLHEPAAAIVAYLQGDLAAPDALAVDGGGTGFQRRAWQALRAIPPGETRTYGQMAALLGTPNGARAVGLANALNPISLIVPCHRVLGAGGVTRIGNRNWIMAYCHIAHDCQIDDDTTLANNTTMAGHVHLGNWVTVGGLTGIHQFVKIGAHAMVGFASAVSQDVPPYMLVDGNPLAVRGINSVGLRRRDFSPDRLRAVKLMHRLLYREGKTLEDARRAIAELAAEIPDASADVALMNAFLADASRGIAR